MSRKELLFLTNLLPYPLDDGASFKTYHVLRYLSRTWEITLISFIRSLDEQKYRSELEKICHRIEMVPIRRSRILDFGHFIKSLVSPKPFLIRRDYSKRMQNTVDEVFKRAPSVTIYVDHLHMAQYVYTRTQLKILDEHNLESELTLRYSKVVKHPVKKLIAYLDFKKMRTYEVRTCRSFDLVLTVTEKERQALLDFGVPDTYCLPIGVDTKKLKQLDLNRKSKTIVFLGTMYWPPNTDAVLWFFHRIFPIIRRSVPEVRLSIIGSNPPRAIRKLALDTNVNVLGYVDDPEAHLTDCAAFIVPLRIGGGMRVKILNAFSWGLPVVTTTLGVEGIEALDNRHLLIRDDPGNFADAVVQLIEDRELRMRLSLEGRKAAETVYDWEILSKRMDGIFNRIVKPR